MLQSQILSDTQLPLKCCTFPPGQSARRLANLLTVWSGGLALGTVAAVCSGNEQFYRDYAMPLLHRLLDPETAHQLAVSAAGSGFVPLGLLQPTPSDRLATEVFGRRFRHPLGLAAGFDKDARAVDGLLKLGFSFVEVGSVTPAPQPGNPKPRVFRLVEDSAIINRYGFNSCGHDAALANLLASDWFARRSQSDASAAAPGAVAGDDWVGVNLGVNRGSAQPVADYAAGAARFAAVADYLVVNVSSPNTPGLRDLQRRRWLAAIVDAVVGEAARATEAAPAGGNARRKRGRPLVLLKVSPDCTDAELSEICSVAVERGADGLIVSNTTVSRPAGLRSPMCGEAGGLSGRPLQSLANRAISVAYALAGDRLTIVGVGGVDSGADALDKLEAGASLLQLYTALALEGPPVIGRINRELAELLEQRGYASVRQAVGAAHRRERAK